MFYKFELLEIKSISLEKFNENSERYLTKRILNYGFLHMNKRSKQIYCIGQSKVVRNNQPELFKEILESFGLFGEKEKLDYEYYLNIKQKRNRNSDLNFCKSLIRKNGFKAEDLEL